MSPELLHPPNNRNHYSRLTKRVRGLGGPEVGDLVGFESLSVPQWTV